MEIDTPAGTVRLTLRGGVAAVASAGFTWKARLELERELPSYLGRVGIEGALEPALPADLLGARALENVHAAGVFSVRVAGRKASIWWAQPVDDATLRAGVELLAGLGAARSAGAFR